MWGAHDRLKDMQTIRFHSVTHGTHNILVDNDVCQAIEKLGGKWCVVKKRNGIYFQKRLSGNNLIELHRFIMKPKKGEYVDHINGNTLDNRRENLRICTNSANLRNGRKRTNNTSGHTGIWLDKRSGKWVAEIKVKYKKINLGRSENFNNAVKLREDAEKRYWNV